MAKKTRKQEAMAEVRHMKAMKPRPAGRTWDGVSRPVDDAYREGYERIFGKKENDELAESYKESRRQKKERKDNEDYLKEIKNKL
tara:strand:- start:224 stop:478 length:255 start_codon:yes stop_codon:yes gene_type:complete